MSDAPTLLSDLLHCLGVPHTVAYSDRRFREMTFKSLFGFSRLLGEYGIDNRAWKLSDKSVISSLPTPFVAETNRGFAIVEAVGPDSVAYRLAHKQLRAAVADFEGSMTGVVLLVAPRPEASEPSYGKHHLFDLIGRAKVWVLALSALALLIAGCIHGGLLSHVSTGLLVAVTLAGMGVTWLLVLKSLKVSSRSADKICSVLQEHGCDTVLEQKASSFFGIFSWSEVGISYFTVTMVTLMLFPSMIHELALINGCCLPFTVWSIWYQKFRIRTWCTLCVTTQALLWLQFFCYLLGGWWKGAFPLSPYIWLLGGAYAVALLSTNRVMNFIKRNTLKSVEHEDN